MRTETVSSEMNSVQDDSLSPFDFDPRTRVVYSAGALSQLGGLCRELGSRVLLVTDHGLEDVGHPQRAIQILESAGLNVSLFDDVHPNPTTEDVERGLQVAKAGRVDVIVGLGGGSSMDCAKGINFILTNGGKIEDYWGIGKAKQAMLPMIAVPTTSGTGSEAQSFALIANPKTHMKMACGDKKAACRIALLDPELTVTMPASVTAVTGIDAISHALETYVTTKRNPVSQMFSRRAWSMLAPAFARVLESPSDIDARGAMLAGAHFAGAAIENSMLGATHALANPLSAHFGTTHGIAIGVMLPLVIRFNGEDDSVRRLYGDLASDMGLCDANAENAAELLADFVRSLVTACGLPSCLAECQIDADLIPTMSQEAAKQWTGTFNPRPVSVDMFRELYESAFDK